MYLPSTWFTLLLYDDDVVGIAIVAWVRCLQIESPCRVLKKSQLDYNEITKEEFY